MMTASSIQITATLWVVSERGMVTIPAERSTRLIKPSPPPTAPAANTADPPASHDWTVDTADPDTSITSSPPSLTNSPEASFTFTSTETSSTFECNLDGAGFTSCSSPKSYSSLSDGDHTFAVRATDPAGNTDDTPASHDWTVDTADPDTSITGAPASLTNSPEAS